MKLSECILVSITFSLMMAFHGADATEETSVPEAVRSLRGGNDLHTDANEGAFLMPEIIGDGSGNDEGGADGRILGSTTNSYEYKYQKKKWSWSKMKNVWKNTDYRWCVERRDGNICMPETIGMLEVWDDDRIKHIGNGKPIACKNRNDIGDGSCKKDSTYEVAW
eukprot:CAMPEP_0197468176 /NCGR_PEP_ID=MMETSP1175-20131217/65947_1 /TAXON_ID=1003142 /ORGANISM="Triceratium dubium, Strain CCMP147" /LENGTH=164 /DNA_ID=CAMNT_0043004271 /DNA_START=618 /DNA_END=1109 /DNA_ORIENTATION=-